MPHFFRNAISQTLGKSRNPPLRSVRKPRDPELVPFMGYLAALRRYNCPPEFFLKHDLENSFFWLFRLNELLALGHKTFDTINIRQFGGQLTRPKIIYCRRATGGYYDHRTHTIGISIGMTIEFGEHEFFETLLHEIAHIKVRSHSSAFYAVLEQLGGTGRKAPRTQLLELKHRQFVLKNYPILVACPNCGLERRYRTRGALRYACKACCLKYNRGKFDSRFILREKVAEQGINSH